MFEFVAEGRGAFKFEFFGGFEHLFFEVENGFIDAVFYAVFGHHAFNGFIGGGIDRFKAFLNLFLDGLWGNVVFEKLASVAASKTTPATSLAVSPANAPSV